VGDAVKKEIIGFSVFLKQQTFFDCSNRNGYTKNIFSISKIIGLFCRRHKHNPCYQVCAKKGRSTI